ncbi:hypothetical protein SAMN05660330_03963 [Desulforhopalus singaporensis]|uniref:Uncharacterized protein n=1 Tax=Desulforhopalus singaporensis TaxID=91360 RepID=A0A1H0VAS7_9BACT|nr:hypothetical protein SAMN05660330_03963 [Desulforhopalus singaporensis]
MAVTQNYLQSLPDKNGLTLFIDYSPRPFMVVLAHSTFNSLLSRSFTASEQFLFL